MRKIILIISLIIAIGQSAISQTVSTSTFSGPTLPNVGQSFDVPINANDFPPDAWAFIAYLEYDLSILTYTGFTNTSGLLDTWVTVTQMPSNRLRIQVADPGISDPFTLPDGKVVDLHFTFNGGYTDMLFPTSGSEKCTYFWDENYDEWPMNVINGAVEGGYVSNSISTGSWAVTTNWSLGVVPNAYHNVTVTSGSTAEIGADAVCNSLTIANGGQLTLDAGKTLTDNGNFTIASGGSFIQDGTLAVAGTTTVKRDIAANEWHLISAPISDALSGMFVGKYLQTHTESTNEYTDIIPLDVPLTPMKGYALWGDATGFTATYTGTLNNGSQSYATSYTAGDKGWNLVGNPYPSSIDWEASGWTKEGVNNATYVHVNASTWASFVDGAGDNGGSQFIAPGQGFFVQATASGTLGMDNSVRTHSAAPFFKSTVSNLVRLQVSGNGYADEAVIRILSEATSEFDGNYDAVKLYGDVAEAAQIYTLGSSPLAINALPETNSVPVGIHAGASGTYTIAATEVNDIQAITLKDNQTGISTNLLVNSYSFSFTPGENEQRFTLYFSPLSINEVENPLASIYSNQNTLYVDLKSLSKGDIYVYNLAGQLVTSASANQGMNMIRLTNTGNYIVKVITPKTTLVKKVFIQ